jgi:hypothetical protein
VSKGRLLPEPGTIVHDGDGAVGVVLSADWVWTGGQWREEIYVDWRIRPVPIPDAWER